MLQSLSLALAQGEGDEQGEERGRPGESLVMLLDLDSLVGFLGRAPADLSSVCLPPRPVAMTSPLQTSNPPALEKLLTPPPAGTCSRL